MSHHFLVHGNTVLCPGYPIQSFEEGVTKFCTTTDTEEASREAIIYLKNLIIKDLQGPTDITDEELVLERIYSLFPEIKHNVLLHEEETLHYCMSEIHNRNVKTEYTVEEIGVVDLTDQKKKNHTKRNHKKRRRLIEE